MSRILKTCLVYALLGTCIALAQEDSTILLQDAVISGTRFEQLRREASQNIELIDKKQIAFQNNGTSASLLEQSGNVYVQRSQAGGGSPVLRGFEANKVLIVVDGVRMNNAIFRGGHLQNVLRVDQNILERVEVVMGPSSVNFGSDALGGVMHFRTRDAKLEHHEANAFIRYGAVNKETTIHFDLNFGFKDIAFLSSFTGSSFKDQRMGEQFKSGYEGFGLRNSYLRYNHVKREDELVQNSDPYLQVNSGYAQVDFLQKVKFTTGKLIHGLNFQASLSNSIPRYDRLTDRDAAGNLRFAEWNYGPEMRLLAAYNLKLPQTKYFDIANISAHAQAFAESRNTRRAFDYLRTSQNEDVNVKGINADFQKIIEKHSMQYGLELINNQVSSKAKARIINDDSSNEFSAQTRYPDGGSATNSYAVYLSDHFKISPKFILNGGLRYTYADLSSLFKTKTFFPFEVDEVMQNNAALSGNTGLVYFPSPNSKIRALFSSGFRTPNVDDLAKVFDSAAGTLIVPNPNLGPEFSNNLEFGLSQNFDERFKIEATYFYSFLQDAIVVADFTLKGASTVVLQGVESKVVAMQNQAKAQIYGWNTNANFQFTKYITLSSMLNKTSGKLSDGTPLDHIPPLFGKTALAFQNKKLELEAFSMYNGWKRLEDYSPNGEDNVQYASKDGTPSWWTINLRSSYKPIPTLSVQLAIENILDKNYRNFASGISAPGRNILITIRKKF